MSKAERTRASMDAIDQRILSIGREYGPLSSESLRWLKATLTAHGSAVREARSDHLTIRGPIWRSVDAISEHLTKRLCPLVLDRFDRLLPSGEPTAERRVADEASVIEYAEAIAAIFAWEAAVGRHVSLRSDIRKRLMATSTAILLRIESHVSLVYEADIPDFRQLGRELLRAEVAEWAFRLAGSPEHAAEIMQRANRAARQSVAWAGRVFERFKAEPDEFSHFDAVATIAAVDELLVAILRVHDGDRTEREAGSHPFVLTIGQQALQEFVTGLEHMTTRYLEIADSHLYQDGAAGAFVRSVLQVLQRILRLERVLVPVVGAVGIELRYDATVKRLAAMRSKLKSVVGTRAAPADCLDRQAILDAILASAAPRTDSVGRTL